MLRHQHAEDFWDMKAVKARQSRDTDLRMFVLVNLDRCGMWMKY